MLSLFKRGLEWSKFLRVERNYLPEKPGNQGRAWLYPRQMSSAAVGTLDKSQEDF